MRKTEPEKIQGPVPAGKYCPGNRQLDFRIIDPRHGIFYIRIMTAGVCVCVFQYCGLSCKNSVITVVITELLANTIFKNDSKEVHLCA